AHRNLYRRLSTRSSHQWWSTSTGDQSSPSCPCPEARIRGRAFQPALATSFFYSFSNCSGKASNLAGADLVWHRWVASIGKSLALSDVCAIRAEVNGIEPSTCIQLCRFKHLTLLAPLKYRLPTLKQNPGL